MRTATCQDRRQAPRALHNPNELKYCYSHFTDVLRDEGALQGHTSGSSDATDSNVCALCRVPPTPHPETKLLPVRGWARALGSASRKAALPRPPARIHRCAAEAARPKPGPPAHRGASGPASSSLAPGPRCRLELLLSRPPSDPRAPLFLTSLTSEDAGAGRAGALVASSRRPRRLGR